MTRASRANTTELLVSLLDGDRAALDQLVLRVQTELRRLARGSLRRERPNHSLDSIALVNEAYLRLVDEKMVVADRGHFLGLAARRMRQVLVDHARKSRASKRGGGEHPVPLADASPPEQGLDPAEVLDVHEALARLEELDPRQARIVELLVYGGATIEETAASLDLSVSTVKREWVHARAWLRRQLTGGRE